MAYLAVSNGQLSVRPFLGGVRKLTIGYSFTLHNLGNSPATIESFDFRPTRLPEGWTIEERYTNDQQISFVRVRSAVLWNGWLEVQLTPRAVWALTQIGHTPAPQRHYSDCNSNCEVAANAVEVRGIIVYRDIFGNDHKAESCWANKEFSYIPTQLPYPRVGGGAVSAPE
jgi:hypothetical protein